MKSADPKVLHQAARIAPDRARPARRRSLQPSTSVVVVGHLSGRVEEALGKTAGPALCIAGAAARHRARAAAGRTAPGGTVGHAWCCCRATCRCCGRRRCRRWSRRTRRSGAAATVLTARVDRPDGYGRIVREDGAHRRDRRAQGRDAGGAARSTRSTAASTPSTLEPLFEALRVDRLGERAGRVLPAGPGADLPRARARGRDRRARRPAGDPGREQPEGAGRRGGDSERRRRTTS